MRPGTLANRCPARSPISMRSSSGPPLLMRLTTWHVSVRSPLVKTRLSSCLTFTSRAAFPPTTHGLAGGDEASAAELVDCATGCTDAVRKAKGFFPTTTAGNRVAVSPLRIAATRYRSDTTVTRPPGAIVGKDLMVDSGNVAKSETEV